MKFQIHIISVMIVIKKHGCNGMSYKVYNYITIIKNNIEIIIIRIFMFVQRRMLVRIIFVVLYVNIIVSYCMRIMVIMVIVVMVMG